MVFKWALVFFGVMATGLFVLSKILAFFNPPRPGRAHPLVLRRVERALRWTVLLPLAIVIVLLALALAGRP